jgi:hypothetical protein
MQPAPRVERWTAPHLDVARLLEQDARDFDRKDKPYRVGYPFKVDLGPSSSGIWTEAADGGQVWRLDVQSKDALWVVLGFSKFSLQPGGELRVYDPQMRRVYGPFTSEDVRPHGELWIPPVEGGSAIVELVWPTELREIEPGLRLGTVSHGYKKWLGIGKTFGELHESPAGDPSETDTLGSGPCNIDVACPQGVGWEDQTRSVVGLLFGGSAFCTGSLINNTSNDCTPYVITANHCAVSGSTAASVIFRFNYQRSECGSGSIETAHLQSGSTLVVAYAPSDVKLLLMDDEPELEFNTYYHGWDRSDVQPSRSTGIHHPNCDVKKISHNEDTVLHGVNYGPDHWRVNNWEQGTTEPCSSGSPLFDQNRRFVGQLHGGTASCVSNTWDEYGKFSYSWVGGGSSSSGVRDWLDPENTAAVTLDGIDHVVCLTPQPRLEYASSTIDDRLGNGDGVIDPGDATTVQSSLASLTTGAHANRGRARFGSIAPEATASGGGPLWFELVDTFTCGDPINLRLDILASEGFWSSEFTLATGTALVVESFSDDVESGLTNFELANLSGNNFFQLSTAESNSPTQSWFVTNLGSVADSVLAVTELPNLPEASELRFAHLMRSELGFDGGVLEYCVNGPCAVGGAGWIDAGALIVENGYNVTLSTAFNSPLAGRNAWSGDSGTWSTVRVDLAGLAGQDVRFRWRFASDTSVAVQGWFIDDIVVDARSFSCNPPILLPPGEASAPVGPGSAFTVDKDPGGYALNWSAPTTGGTVEEYSLYSVDLGKSTDNATCAGSLGSETSAIMADLPSAQGLLVVARNSAGEGSFGADGSGAERVTPSATCPIP